jgi:hypothetical protein
LPWGEASSEWTAWIYLVIRTVQSLYRKDQVVVPAVHPHCRNSAVSVGSRHRGERLGGPPYFAGALPTGHWLVWCLSFAMPIARRLAKRRSNNF